MEGSISTRPAFVNASGRNLRKLLHGKPAAERIKVAVILTGDRWHVTRLLPAQAARLAGVSASAVGQALGRPPRRRSDAEIDRIVARLGYDAVMRSLDRLTAPSAAVAAE